MFCTRVTAADINSHMSGNDGDCTLCLGTGHPVDTLVCSACDGGRHDEQVCEHCEGRQVVLVTRPHLRCMAAAAAQATAAIADQ